MTKHYTSLLHADLTYFCDWCG